jgi:hypothetical protein
MDRSHRGGAGVRCWLADRAIVEADAVETATATPWSLLMV